MAEISEMKLNKLGEEIGDNPKLRTLGLNLGLKITKISQYEATNRIDGRVGSKGTVDMLLDWKKNTPRDDQMPVLWAALIEAGLAELADQYICQNGRKLSFLLLQVQRSF